MTYLGLSRDGRDSADLLLLERVNDARLANVRVADEADRDLLLVRVKDGKLAEELDEGTFSEGVVDRSVEGERRSELGEVLHPTSLTAEDNARAQRSVKMYTRIHH